MYTLNSLILHPALSGLIALLFLSGIYKITSLIVHKISGRTESLTGTICGMLIAIGLLSTVSYACAYYGLLGRLAFRIPGYCICCMGFLQSGDWILYILKNRKRIYSLFVKQPILYKIDIVFLLILFISLFCIVYGPPTDADSLNYHLGIPLDIVNHGHIPVRHDWLYYNLIGLGEFWNLIGLLLGTDNLGACTQFVALIMICATLAEITVSQKRRLLIIKLVASTPVLLFLATGQKPQLIGTAAILSAVILILKSKNINKKSLFLSLGSLFFALSIKYSFFMIGSIVFVFIFFMASKAKKIIPFFLFSFLFYTVFLFPLQLHKFLVYKDPLSPILVSVLHAKDVFHVKEFYAMLKMYSEGFGFPVGLLLPNSPGFISTILGIGIFSFLFINKLTRNASILMLLAVAGFALNFIGGQHTSRFFLEAYFLCIAGIACSLQLRKYAYLYSMAVSLQLIVVVTLSCIGAFLLFPGSFSWSNREKVLEKTAIDYSAATMLNNQLPQNSFIVSELLANVFIPRPFLAPEYKNMPASDIVNQIPFDTQKCFLVTKDTVLSTHVLYNFLEKKDIVPIPIHDATRNPFNQKASMLYIYVLKNNWKRNKDNNIRTF